MFVINKLRVISNINKSNSTVRAVQIEAYLHEQFGSFAL